MKHDFLTFSLTIIAPVITINGSYSHVQVGQTVELFCHISFPSFVTIPDNVSYPVEFLHGNDIFQSPPIGSLIHTFTIQNVNLIDAGTYTCAVSSFRSTNSFGFFVFSG